jgi:hypothetical protein
MSARSGITNSIIEELKTALVGSGNYVTNLYTNIGNQSKTFDNINDFPYISVTPGPETREYQPSMQTLADLTVYIRVYVQNNDDPQGELEEIISDLETFIDTHQKISYNISIPGGSEKTFNTYLAEITRITTDEGLLAPFGMAEVAVTVQYEKTRLM